jgi:hypothetical protein
MNNNVSETMSLKLREHQQAEKFILFDNQQTTTSKH